MHDVSSNFTPKNIRELFLHSSDVHTYNKRFSCADKLTKRAFKRKIRTLPLTVLEIEDYYIDAHSLKLNLTTSNYYTLQLSTSHVAVYLLYAF